MLSSPSTCIAIVLLQFRRCRPVMRFLQRLTVTYPLRRQQDNQHLLSLQLLLLCLHRRQRHLRTLWLKEHYPPAYPPANPTKCSSLHCQLHLHRHHHSRQATHHRLPIHRCRHFTLPLEAIPSTLVVVPIMCDLAAIQLLLLIIHFHLPRRAIMVGSKYSRSLHRLTKRRNIRRLRLSRIPPGTSSPLIPRTAERPP
jgi:hypothetical protein